MQNNVIRNNLRSHTSNVCFRSRSMYVKSCWLWPNCAVVRTRHRYVKSLICSASLPGPGRCRSILFPSVALSSFWGYVSIHSGHIFGRFQSKFNKHLLIHQWLNLDFRWLGPQKDAILYHIPALTLSTFYDASKETIPIFLKTISTRYRVLLIINQNQNQRICWSVIYVLSPLNSNVF